MLWLLTQAVDLLSQPRVGVCVLGSCSDHKQTWRLIGCPGKRAVDVVGPSLRLHVGLSESNS